MPSSSTKRAHVVLPEDLVQEIDKIAGSRGRSAFLADLAKREIKRQQLLQIFKREEPIWKDEDHPELKDGAAAWVRKTRTLDEVRFQKIQKRRDRE
jgi:hypothetical protein